jgi:ribosomal protein S18
MNELQETGLTRDEILFEE